MTSNSAADIIGKDRIRDLRDAGFVIIHREPTDAMCKAFYARQFAEQVDFNEGFHRMVAASIKAQNGD